MDQYGYSNVYRVTDYSHPFDGYKGQDVILFEEFRSSISVGNMLEYIEGYPVELPCRYVNKIACYTKVYICSNIPLRKQYPNLQIDENVSYNAFLRRINYVHKFMEYSEEHYTLEEYMSGWRKCYVTPFAK